MAKTVGRDAASWALVAGLAAALAVAQPVGCVNEGPAGETDPAALDIYAQTLERSISEHLLPALRDASERADELQVAAEAWALAPDDLAAKGRAQEAWRVTMTAWQRVEVMQIGPLASPDDPYGEGARDEIYSWPQSFNPCRVDQETAAGEYGSDGWADGALVNVKGLDALERVLFADTENACPSRVPPNSDGGWQALGQAGVRARRAAFAAALSAHVATDMRNAVTATESIAPQLADVDTYGGHRESMNALYDALFYIETASKDRKLAQPLGLRDCDSEDCPLDAEHVASGHSLDALRANIDGFESLFFGGDGYGMDDVLATGGHADIPQSVVVSIAAAREAADALELSIDQGIREDKEAVLALHDALKGLTDTLKGDVATVLSMQIPVEAAGDND